MKNQGNEDLITTVMTVFTLPLSRLSSLGRQELRKCNRVGRDNSGQPLTANPGAQILLIPGEMGGANAAIMLRTTCAFSTLPVLFFGRGSHWAAQSLGTMNGDRPCSKAKDRSTASLNPSLL